MKSLIRVLHLEDSARDAELIREKLKLGGLACNVVLVDSQEGFESAMATDSFDLILCDHNLPGYDGRSAIKSARDRLPSASIVSLSGTLGEEEAVECLKLGAADYVLKPRLDRLVPAVVRALAEAKERRMRREAEDELRKSEERYRAVVEDQLEVICRFKADGTLTFVNQAFCRLVGKTTQELLGRTFQPELAKEDVASVEAKLRTLSPANPTVVVENRLHTPDGNVRWMQFTNRAFYDSEGRQLETQAVGRDITERKQMEEALQASEERFRHAVVDSPFPILLHAEDGAIIQASNSWCEITGYSREELATVGDWTERAYGERRTLVQADIDRLYGLDHRVAEGDYAIRTKSGDTRIWEFSSAPLGRLPDGRRLVISMAMDVTEGRQADAALRASEEQFRAMFDMASIGIAQADPHTGQWLRVNAKMCEITGYSAGELLQMRVADLTHAEDRQPDSDAFQRVVRGAAPDYRMEKRYLRKDGSLAWVNVNMTVLRDAAGQPTRTIATIEDVTERKRTEDALRESNQFTQQIVASAQEGIVVHSRDLRYQVWNPFMEQLTGMRADHVLGKHPDEVFPFLREAGVLASIQKALAGEPTSSIDSHFDGLPSGKSGWTSRTNGPLRNAAGEIIGAIGIVRDITWRKRAELRLTAFSLLGERLSAARSPAEAARAIYASADQFWKWDCGVLDLRVPESSQLDTALAYDLVGGQRREVPPRDPVGPPSAMSLRVMAKGAELVLRKPDAPPPTDTVRFGDAARLSASLMCVPVRVENLAVGVLSVQSYTPDAYDEEDLQTLQALADHCGGALDRLRKEELLRGSEARYRRLFEAAKDGVLILDAKSGMVVDVNPFLVQLLGLSKEALLGKKIWELGSFKDIVANYDYFKELQEKQCIRYEDKPLGTADGRRVDVEFVSNVYQVNHQKVIQCDIRDITARKRTEWLGLIYRDQLRALSARIETMREEERTRLSREIHDELGQMLTGIKMDLRWMEHRLDDFGEDRRVNPILDKLVVTTELTDATIKIVQRIAAELRPGILDKLGLSMALQYEADRFQERTGIACRLVVPDEMLPLRLEAATAFFRIFQEALTNVARHAKATAVEAELQPEADNYRLDIRDNGQGMAGVDLTNLKSLGLLGMQERAALLGGSVSFAPRPGGGTVVTVRIPIGPAKQGSA